MYNINQIVEAIALLPTGKGVFLGNPRFLQSDGSTVTILEVELT